MGWSHDDGYELLRNVPGVNSAALLRSYPPEIVYAVGKLEDIRVALRLMVIEAEPAADIAQPVMPSGWLTIRQICEFFGRSPESKSPNYTRLRNGLRKAESEYRKSAGRKAEWIDKTDRAFRYNCDDRNVKDVLNNW